MANLISQMINTEYWSEHIADYGPNSVIVDNTHYWIGEEPKPGESRSFLGHAGREFKIRFNDGREVTTHNLWYQGPIPTRFRDRLQNNAEFVS